MSTHKHTENKRYQDSIVVQVEDQRNSKGNGGTSSSSFVVIGENHTAGRRAIELNL
jgi:hypothetical protein